MTTPREAGARVSSIPCCLCGGECIEFTVPNELWNRIIRPDGREHDKEYLCVQCFAQKCAEFAASKELADLRAWFRHYCEMQKCETGTFGFKRGVEWTTKDGRLRLTEKQRAALSGAKP